MGETNWLVLRVENGARYDWLPGTPIVEWVQYGGILAPVELLTTGPVHLAHVGVRATPSEAGAFAEVSVAVRNASGSAFDGRVLVRVAQGRADAPVRVPAGASETATVSLTIPGAPRWSLEQPALEAARVELRDGRGVLDAVEERFGVRSIEARGREILLNGRPVRVRGVNRYDESPGRGPVVDEARIREDLLAVKKAGANLVRMHYPQSPAHLRVADETGLLVIEEVPLNWWRAPWHQNNRAFALADLVAVNLYFGMFQEPLARDASEIEERVHRPTLERLRAIARLFPDKPLLLSEFGTVGVPGWRGPLRSSEDFQAAYIAAVWRAIAAVPEVAGGVVWSRADYRHRRGFRNGFATEFGLFGLVSLDRRPKAALAAMERLWREETEAGHGGRP